MSCQEAIQEAVNQLENERARGADQVAGQGQGPVVGENQGQEGPDIIFPGDDVEDAGNDEPRVLSIINFEASKRIIQPEEEIILSWETLQADFVWLGSNKRYPNQFVALNGEFKIKPTESVTLNLVAYSRTDSVEASIEILVQDQNQNGEEEEEDLGPDIIEGADDNDGELAPDGNRLGGDNPEVRVDREDDVVDDGGENGPGGVPGVDLGDNDIAGQDDSVGGNDNEGGILPGNDNDFGIAEVPGVLDLGPADFIPVNCPEIDEEDFEDFLSVSVSSQYIVVGESTTLSWNFPHAYQQVSTVVKENNQVLAHIQNTDGDYVVRPQSSGVYSLSFSYCGQTIASRNFSIKVWNWQGSQIRLPRNTELANVSENQDRSGFYLSTIDYTNFPTPTIYSTTNFSQNNLIYQNILQERLPGGNVDLINTPIKTSLLDLEACGGLSYFSTEGFIFRTEDGQILGSNPDQDVDHVGNDDTGPLVFISRSGQRITPAFMFNDPVFSERIYYAQPDGLVQLDDCSARNDLNFTRNFPIFNDQPATDYAVNGNHIFILSGRRLIVGEVSGQERSWREIRDRDGGYDWLESGERWVLAGKEDQLLMINERASTFRVNRIPGLIMAKEVVIDGVSYVVALTNQGLFLNTTYSSTWYPLSMPNGVEEASGFYSIDGQSYLWIVNQSDRRIFKLSLRR